jgi:heterodisulfide reductase subunit A
MNRSKPRIGAYVCRCGTNIAATVNVDEVISYLENMGEVTIARGFDYMCSDPGQDLIKEDIEKFDLNRVVVASCSPLMHETTFRQAVEEGGINPYYFQMANIREQCSWVIRDKEKATRKAQNMIEAAINRVRQHHPLSTRSVSMEPTVLVVGGGISGIEASLKIADAGKKVILVERETSIGGHMAQLYKTFPTLDCAA